MATDLSSSFSVGESGRSGNERIFLSAGDFPMAVHWVNRDERFDQWTALSHHSDTREIDKSQFRILCGNYIGINRDASGMYFDQSQGKHIWWKFRRTIEMEIWKFISTKFCLCDFFVAIKRWRFRPRKVIRSIGDQMGVIVMMLRRLIRF
jgi:hypothetical protein